MVPTLELSEEGPELLTPCLAEDEPVAECHRLESIVPEGGESVERIAMDFDAAVRATVSEQGRQTGMVRGDTHEPHSSAL